ncbi:MAG: DUF2358 domain-containing protein [Leptolyngbya sp. SIO4C1]|nr:DUF2358 domain-containing protein [Leptolyngbya sp. SIO4C1]
MDMMAQIKADYETFPHDQSFELYAQDVYFKDPLNEFRGVARYRSMIGLIEKLFQNHQLDLHGISQPQPDTITTEWTLHLTAPVPWQPRLSIPGWSELKLNADGLISSHVDYWHCSRWSVVQQLWS